MTAATPMTMPSSVSPARSLLAPIEESAVRNVVRGLIARLLTARARWVARAARHGGCR